MYPLKKNIERPAGAVVYYSMNNLRGRLGSTRQVRGLGCDTDSSTTSEGIIEGCEGLYPTHSDLSPLPLFGGGETRESELFVELWGVRQAYATPLPYFL